MATLEGWLNKYAPRFSAAVDLLGTLVQSHPVHAWELVSTKTQRTGDASQRWSHYRCKGCPVERHSMET